MVINLSSTSSFNFVYEHIVLLSWQNAQGEEDTHARIQLPVALKARTVLIAHPWPCDVHEAMTTTDMVLKFARRSVDGFGSPFANSCDDDDDEDPYYYMLTFDAVGFNNNGKNYRIPCHAVRCPLFTEPASSDGQLRDQVDTKIIRRCHQSMSKPKA